MGRKRRRILSNGVYEVCLRTRVGLPFAHRRYMSLIIEGILARVQRDEKVVICAQIWMKNHVHLLIVAKDIRQCERFYGQVQKQLTEAMKRLLGLSHLNLWHANKASVIQLYDIQGVINRIAYFYANPANAHQTDRIEDYTGLSTWDVFKDNNHQIDYSSEKVARWIRAPHIRRLPKRNVSIRQDRHLSQSMLAMTEEEHTLVVRPNAWMEAFGIREPERIASINNRIEVKLRELEEKARVERAEKKIKLVGARRLIEEPMTLNYIPRKNSVSLAVYAADPKLRKWAIWAYKEFCKRCRECYERWKLGEKNIEWPPGAILPAPPPLINHFFR